jgi:hypothetical protein
VESGRAAISGAARATVGTVAVSADGPYAQNMPSVLPSGLGSADGSDRFVSAVQHLAGFGFLWPSAGCSRPALVAGFGFWGFWGGDVTDRLP